MVAKRKTSEQAASDQAYNLWLGEFNSELRGAGLKPLAPSSRQAKEYYRRGLPPAQTLSGIGPLPAGHAAARLEQLKTSTIEKTLKERGARYGEFKHHAQIAQDLQDAMRKPAGWNKLAADQKQALTVIADKIARMLNGDPDYLDNWHDIIGYTKLVEDRLIKEQQA